MFQLGSKGNPFDAGKRVHDGPAGGYDWPLSEHRQYYSLNVLGTQALSHEQYCKEFPKAAAMLAEADSKFVKFNNLLGNPTAAAQMLEVLQHMIDGKPVALAEAFPMQAAPATPMATPQGAAPFPDPNAGAAQSMQGDAHTHQVQCDAAGNGQTNPGPDGHMHTIRANQIMAQGGHTHDFGQMQQQAGGVAPQGGNPVAAGERAS